MRSRIEPAVQIGLSLAVVTLALGGLRVSRQIREQQRRILKQLETQSRVLHNAARLASEGVDDKR